MSSSHKVKSRARRLYGLHPNNWEPDPTEPELTRRMERAEAEQSQRTPSVTIFQNPDSENPSTKYYKDGYEYAVIEIGSVINEGNYSIFARRNVVTGEIDCRMFEGCPDVKDVIHYGTNDSPQEWSPIHRNGIEQ